MCSRNCWPHSTTTQCSRSSKTCSTNWISFMRKPHRILIGNFAVIWRLCWNFRSWVSTELMNQTAQPSTAKQTTKQSSSPPRVLIDQNDLFVNIFSNISDAAYVGKVLMLYITSLAKYTIAPQHDISKMLIVDLVRRNQFDTLQNLIKYSLINESKPLACFLLSLSNAHSSITQMAIDMLYKLNAETVTNARLPCCRSYPLFHILKIPFPSIADHHWGVSWPRKNYRSSSIGEFTLRRWSAIGA